MFAEVCFTAGDLYHGIYMKARSMSRSLRMLGDPEIAAHSKRFFKAGRGGYGEGDRFLGIRVPVLRQLVRVYRDTQLTEVLKLLKSPYHEERLFALLLMVEKFGHGTENEREAIYDAYLANTRYVNNWDLVDSSADKIVGAWLENRSRQPLHRLVHSESLWERRIAIMSTFHLIRLGQFEDALLVCQELLGDSEALVHKAAGWMLREIGERDRQVELRFLRRHAAKMPRTMLRYAIEHFSESERRDWLEKTR